MRLHIVTKDDADSARMLVTSEGARGVVRWVGEVLPECGVDVDVELTINDLVNWQAHTSPSSPLDVWGSSDTWVTVHARIERFDGYGVATLRVGEAVVLVDAAGDWPDEVVGLDVDLVLNQVDVHPTGV